MKKSVKILILILFCSYFANAQSSFKILDFDYSNFPNMSAKFFVFDNNGMYISGFSPSDFVIRDNGLNVNNINSVSCPVSQVDQKLSITLTFDLALSIFDGLNSNFEIGRKIAKKLVSFFPNSEISLTSYDIRNYLNREFTDSIPILLNEINNFNTSPGSLFNVPFFDEPANSFKIVERGKNKKILIFLTDGSGSINDKQIIQEAQSKGIAIYCLVLGKKSPSKIKDLAIKTGGWYFDNINKLSDLSLISYIIRALAYNYQPCEITWKSESSCLDSNEIEVLIPSKSVKDIINFSFSNSEKSTVEADPRFIGFSSVDSGKTKSLSLTLTARNRDVLIQKLMIDSPFTITAGNVTNYLLKKDQFINVTIEYAPLRQALVFAELKVISDACSITPVFITGGFPNVKPVEKTIKIVFPNGGETLIIGDTSFVSWMGLLPKDVIQLEYSIDNGKNWKTLGINKSGLKFDWIIPNEPTDSCLVRIIQIWPNNVEKILELKHQNSVNSGFFNKEGDLVLTASSDTTAAVWLSNNGSRKFTLKGHSKPVTWASFSPDERFITTVSSDSTVKIWNQSDGTLLKTLTDHKSRIESVSWSDSGEYFSTSDYSGEVIVWDTNFTVQQKIKSNDLGPTWFVCFNPKNTQEIATANLGGKVKVWNWKNYKNGDKEVGLFDTKSNNCKHVTYNKDGSKIAATTSSADPKCLFIWDTSVPVTPLFSITHNNDSTSNNSINFSSFFDHPTLKKELILTSSSDQTARLWDATDGSQVPLLNNNIIAIHKNSVSSAVYDRFGSRVLTTSWDSTAKIWKLEDIELQQDISDSVFRIDVAKAELKNVEFGELSKGEVKDSLVKAVIINKSGFSYPLLGVSIEGLNKEDFAINNELNFPLTLKPYDSINIEFRFLPTDYGSREADLVVTIPAKVIKVKLTGFGIEHDLYANNPLVDFKIVDIGNYKDTTFSAIVINRSSNVILIDTVKLVGSYKNEFSINKGNDIKSINPGQDLFLSLRLSPETLGRKNAQIQFDYKGFGNPTIINLFGEGVEVRNDSLTLYIKDISGSPGDTVHIPIYIKNISERGIHENVSGFFVNMKFNSTLLEPLSGYEESSINGYERTLKLKLPKTFGADSILKDMEFKVGFGNDSVSVLKLEYCYPIGLSRLYIKEEPGTFTVTGLCKDGGTRLFDPNGRLFLNTSNPNPAIGTTTISFGILESGFTELFITNVVGKKVKVLINKHLTAGTYEVAFNSDELNPGFYSFILKSSTKILTKQIQIIK